MLDKPVPSILVQSLNVKIHSKVIKFTNKSPIFNNEILINLLYLIIKMYKLMENMFTVFYSHHF